MKKLEIYLVGPAASGKTQLVKALDKALQEVRMGEPIEVVVKSSDGGTPYVEGEFTVTPELGRYFSRVTRK